MVYRRSKECIISGAENALKEKCPVFYESIKHLRGARQYAAYHFCMDAWERYCVQVKKVNPESAIKKSDFYYICHLVENFLYL